jgi:cytochrome c-type biogenesis protein CcmH
VRRAALLAAAALALALPAMAAGACPKTTLGDLEDEVMCPVCGTPLSVATEAPQAQRERGLIERLIAQCRSKDEIKRVLVAEFGSEVLATPEDEGFDLAAWLVPGLALLFGAGVVAVVVRRWRRNRWQRWPDHPPGNDPGDPAGDREPRRPEPPSGAAAARLDADIERYDL